MLTESKHIPSEYTELLMQVQQTEANIDIDSDLTVFLQNTEMYLLIVEQPSSRF